MRKKCFFKKGTREFKVGDFMQLFQNGKFALVSLVLCFK